MELPTIDEIAKEVTERALDKVTYEGKTLREWAKTIAKQLACEDCINRTELLSRIDAERKHLLDLKMDGAEHIIVHHARRIIEDMPSVTPQPKRGKWIKVGEWSEGFGMGEVYGWFYECSECSEQVKNGYGECSYNYCPYCGSHNRDLKSLGESFADGYEDGLEEK